MLARKALAGTAGAPKEYVEDVFSTYLYTGTGSTLSIDNGIDLSTEGGLVWGKSRNGVATAHWLFDTARGATKYLMSQDTSGETTSSTTLTSFNSNGFTLGTSSFVNSTDTAVNNYVSWTFRKAKKFFDVVTYTGNGTAGRTVSHNLGSTPGCIIIKRTNTAKDWAVYHRSRGKTEYGLLNSTAAFADDAGDGRWNDTDPTSTVFTLGNDSEVNANGDTYVAYLFAHDAGGFGDDGSDSIIKCGSYTGNASTGGAGPVINLGWEPQWILFKRASGGTDNWRVYDVMRGLSFSTNALLYPNATSIEAADNPVVVPNATGFSVNSTGSGINQSGDTIIYIAIRRGPMKTPTSGTSVFSPVASSASTGTTLTTNFPIDMQLSAFLSGYSNNTAALDRLRGVSSTTTETVVRLTTSSTGAESTSGIASRNWSNTGFEMPSALGGGGSIFWNFRRAPGFFDVVCYTGTGSNLTVAHNLGVVPELIIAKNRTTAGNNWPVLFNFTSTNSSYAFLNLTSAGGNDTYANVGVMTAQPTSTNLLLSSSGSMNTSGNGHVAYLFASLSGVSKVGTYTGNGSSQTINCGFSAGARFVLIKRTDSTGDWPVFNSARGIVSGNDPYIRLNTTDAEVTDKDALDPDNSGFIVNETTGPNINTNGATYIYLAIS